MPHLGIGNAELIASSVLGACLVWISIRDLHSLRIPDRASLPLLGMGVLLATLPGGIGLQTALIGTVAGYLSFAAIGEWFFRRTGQDGLGLGDAKLLAAAGAWLGWRDLPLLVAMAAIAALFYGLLTRQHRLAFGPWLSAAFWLLWLRHIAG